MFQLLWLRAGAGGFSTAVKNSVENFHLHLFSKFVVPCSSFVIFLFYTFVFNIVEVVT